MEPHGGTAGGLQHCVEERACGATPTRLLQGQCSCCGSSPPGRGYNVPRCREYKTWLTANLLWFVVEGI